jgi:holliday junction DNA helicase RuvB
MNNLRPTHFKDLVGQSKLINALKISVDSANARNEALNHCLFSGSAGLGKTTLSEALANELGVSIQIANGANLRSIKNLLPYLTRATERSIVFIDEIHRMTTLVEEFMYPVMEDFKLNMTDGEEVISIDLPKFTIVGATTEEGSLEAPLRDRFKLKFTLELYDELSLSCLIENNCKKLNVNMSDEAIFSLASVSRGTPRIANGLLEWVRDYQIAKNLDKVCQNKLFDSLALRGIDPDGSTDNDRKYLNFIRKQKSPVGVNTIASSININKDTITHVIEPFLLQNNLIIKTSKGRVAV